MVRDLLAILKSWRASGEMGHPLAGVAIVFGAGAAVCALMVVLAPSIAFDPVALHLPSVQYYIARHALTPVPGIDYSYYPQGVEVLWTLMYALAGQAGARLVSGLFFPIFLMSLFRIGRVCGLDRGAAVTGVAFAATLPFLHWTGSVVKNDLALALFQALALYAFLCWLKTRDFRSIVVGVFFLAETFGVKHLAMFGAVPLAMLFGYAVWNQRQRWRAAAIAAAVLIVFGSGWELRTYFLTGNPVYPQSVSILKRGSLEIHEHSTPRKMRRYAEIPWMLMFHGQDSFESPLPNPAGIVLFAFAPLALGVRFKSLTRQQIACAVFTALNLIFWAWDLDESAVCDFSASRCSHMWMAGLAKKFYDAPQRARAVRISLIGVETYCLLIALMGLMIVGVNGPQILYFARRLDQPGYLRAAMHAYGAVEFVNTSGGPHPRVFGVDNLTRAYESDATDSTGSCACRVARAVCPELSRVSARIAPNT